MILSDRDLRTYLARGELVVTPLDSDVQIQPCSIDLRLANEVKRYKAHAMILDARTPVPEFLVDEVVADGYPLVICPHEMVLARTVERVEIPPSLVGKVEGRSSLGRLGIQIHKTAGWIDPGFRGTITLEISNQNSIPVALWPGDRICQLVLYRLTSEAQRPYGTPGLGSKYQDQTAVVGAKVDGGTE